MSTARNDERRKRQQHPETTPASRPSEPRLADFGGQYRPAEGVSTRDKSDRQRDAEALADFNAALEEARYGVVSGREW